MVNSVYMKPLEINGIAGNFEALESNLKLNYACIISTISYL